MANLTTSLGSLASLMAVSKERLSLCPGVGAKKVQRLHDAFAQPFLVRKKPRTEGGEDVSSSSKEADADVANSSKECVGVERVAGGSVQEERTADVLICGGSEVSNKVGGSSKGAIVVGSTVEGRAAASDSGDQSSLFPPDGL